MVVTLKDDTILAIPLKKAIVLVRKSNDVITVIFVNIKKKRNKIEKFEININGD